MIIIIIVTIIITNIIIILDLENLKLIIDGHISLVVKVSHGDLQAVTALGGELVKLFKAKPTLTWKNFFYISKCVPVLTTWRELFIMTILVGVLG